MQQSETPILSLRFTIPLEDFRQYGLVIGQRQFAKRRTRTTVSGIVETVLAVILIIYVFSQQNVPQFIYILCVILLFLGIYSLVFYHVLFPRLLLKNAESNYKKSTYLQSEIVLDLYEDRIEEKAENATERYRWRDIEMVMEPKMGYAIHVSEKRTILIPKSQLGEKQAELEALLKQVCQQNEKEYQTI